MSNPLNYRASTSAMYYSPERRIQVGRTAIGFVGAAALAGVGGYIYARLQPQIENVYLRIGQLIAGAIAVGLIGILPVRYGRVRLPVVVAFMGAALAFIAVYVMWLTWVHEVMNKAGVLIPYGALLRRPMVLLRLIQYLNRAGTMKWDGVLVRGIPLLVLWLIEFAAMLAAGVLIPLKAIVTDDPICRQCGAVCRLVRPIARFAADRQADLVAAVEAHDFAAVARHDPPANDDEPQLSLRLVSCPQCGQTNVVTVNHIAWSMRTNASPPKLQIKPMINQLLVPPVEAQELRTIIKQIAEARQAAAEATAEAEEPRPDGPAEEATQDAPLTHEGDLGS